jgi:two-component sensor histidine kinase
LRESGERDNLCTPSFYADHKIVSTVDVLIPGSDGPYGVLEVDSPVERIYDEYDINFLTGFANCVAGAVDSSRRRASNAATIREKDRLLTVQRALLDEKALLARELNHRVRNNLQLIHGMLEREILSYSANNSVGMHGFTAIGRRIIALSRIYDHLLGTGLTQTIDFRDYLSSLCSSLAAVENAEKRGITITYDLEPVRLTLESISSLGLIVTELVTNSFEHAFPNGGGFISVSLKLGQHGENAAMIIRDNGVGFPVTVSGKHNGLGLVNRLIEQLGGSANYRSDDGTEWRLTIPASAMDN